VYYGHIHALKGISLVVDEREIVALLGSNGAGKTTTLRTISGLHRARDGAVRLEAHRIDGRAPHEIVGLGIGHAPEGRRIFGRLTVRENLEMGAYRRSDAAGIRQDLDRVMTLFPRLRERLTQIAGTLSGGEQQMLAIARVLVADAKLLLLDEPTEGLAPAIVEQLRDVLLQVRASGKHSIFLVEQNLRFALTLASRGYVMEKGRIVAEGDPSHLEGEEVIARHLSI
jgi:branched-chain amino acid transport system ATP-binding protein